jgi:hypothetical protein
VRRTAITMAVLGLALAGCTAGAGSPIPSPTSTTTESVNLNGAPHVANPLDTVKMQANPCASVTSAQLDQLDIGTTGKQDNVGGPACDWGSDSDPTKSGATISYLTSATGLSTVYGQKGTYALFQPLPPISGYPAVLAAQSDERSTGNCDVTVGVSDKLAMDVVLTVNSGPQKADPCTPAEQLAADAISNIKAGGSK